MKKLFFALFFLPFLLFAREENYFSQRKITQLCGFTIGEKLQENRFVKQNRVRWQRRIEESQIMTCFPPVKFMDFSWCALGLLKDGRIAMIALRMKIDTMQLSETLNYFDQVRKRVAAVYNVPFSELSPMELELSWKTMFVYVDKETQEKFCCIITTEGITDIQVIMGNESLINLYNQECDERTRKQALKEDAAAFGL